MHSTNYKNTLIEIAEDCKAAEGQIPPSRGEKKTVANLEYELISSNPYKYTSDDIKFKVHSLRNSIAKPKERAERQAYFSKGQPCFRASPLTKSYGWGVHSNEAGKIALLGCESSEYARFLKDAGTEKVKAMRSKRN